MTTSPFARSTGYARVRARVKVTVVVRVKVTIDWDSGWDSSWVRVDVGLGSW